MKSRSGTSRPAEVPAGIIYLLISYQCLPLLVTQVCLYLCEGTSRFLIRSHEMICNLKHPSHASFIFTVNLSAFVAAQILPVGKNGVE